jgi:flagellar hook-length control protein FliK
MDIGMPIASLILGEVAPNPNIAVSPTQPKGSPASGNAQLDLVTTGNPVAAGTVDTEKADNIPILIQVQPQSFPKILAEAIAGKVLQKDENITATATTENKPPMFGELVQPNSELLQLLQNTTAEVIVGKPLTKAISGNTSQQGGNTLTPEKATGLVNIAVVQGLPVVITEAAVNPANANPEQEVLPALQAENKPIPNMNIAGNQPNTEAVLIDSADKSNNVVAVDGGEIKKDNGNLAIIPAKVSVTNKILNGDEGTTNATKEGVGVTDKPANSNVQNPVGPEGKLLASAFSTGQQTPASPGQQMAVSTGQQIPASPEQQTPASNSGFALPQSDFSGLQVTSDPAPLPVPASEKDSATDKQAGDKPAGNQRGKIFSEVSADIVKGFQIAANNASAGKNGQMANQLGAESSNPTFVQTLQNRADSTAGSSTNIEQMLSITNVQQTPAEQTPSPQVPAADVVPQGQQKQQLMEQIFESIQSSMQQDSRQITIRLNPPELGKVFIKFQENNDHIVGILKVSEAQTRYDIEKVLPQLIQHLTDCGVVIKRLEVVLADQPEQQGFKEQVPQNNQEGWANNQKNMAEENNSGKTYTNEWGTNGGYGEADGDIVRLSDSFITDKSMNVLV